MNCRRKIVTWTQSRLLLNTIEPGHLRSKMLTEEIVAFIYSACLMLLPREPEASIQAFVRQKKPFLYFSRFRLKYMKKWMPQASLYLSFNLWNLLRPERVLYCDHCSVFLSASTGLTWPSSGSDWAGLFRCSTWVPISRLQQSKVTSH